MNDFYLKINIDAQNMIFNISFYKVLQLNYNFICTLLEYCDILCYLEFIVDDLGVGGLFDVCWMVVPAGGNPVVRVNLPFSAGARWTIRIMFWLGRPGLRTGIIAEKIFVVIGQSFSLYKPVNLSMRHRSPLVLWVSVLVVLIGETPHLVGLGEYQEEDRAHYK